MKKLGSHFKTPTTFLKKMQSWARNVFIAHVHKSAENRYYKALYTYEDPKNATNDALLNENYFVMQDMKKIIVECKKLYPTRAAKIEETVTSYFPVKDIMDDWDYLKDTDRQYADTTLSANGWSEFIRVDFHLKDNEKAAGFWHSEDKKIELFSKIEFDTVPQLEDALSFLLDTVRHEIQHLCQDLLQDLRLLPELAGMPPRGARSTSTYDSSATPRHANTDFDPDDLNDDEFYPRLRDAILEFLRLMPYESDHEAFFRFWISLHPEYEPDNPELSGQPNQFFDALKIYDTPKWRKAVHELWKFVAPQIKEQPPVAERLREFKRHR